ncbi:MAG: alpha/beta hydrolase, partial [Acidimicrobiia bacterium]|nr:alpha/beta hydrolase [Acidimicrobiia bacterium]
ILDSPFPPNADTPEAETLSFLWSFERLVAECAADAYCAETYPDLEDTLLDVVVSYNEDPGEITGDDIVVGIGQAFADTSAIGLIPWTIYELRAGNEDALFELTGQEWSRRFQSDDVTDSEGMYNSVICADEYTTGDFERIEAAVVGEIPPELESALLQPVFELTNLCSYWHPRVSVDDSPVVSDIPALVLVGGYDTATPPLWGELTVQTLSNGYLVEIPGSGHNVLNEACPIEIATQFLDDPFTRPDTACLASIDWPYFE